MLSQFWIMHIITFTLKISTILQLLKLFNRVNASVNYYLCKTIHMKILKKDDNIHVDDSLGLEKI